MRAVAAPHHHSVDAARRVLEWGGNAVDAAIAAVVTQGVVAPETCGIGGDLFALVHRPGWERPRALNASGKSGSNASLDRLGDVGPGIPREHPLTVTIPGCADGVIALSTELGNLDLGDALAPAIEFARSGFEVSTEQALAFGRQREMYGSNPAVVEFYPGGEPVKKGHRVEREALAVTLDELAANGRDGFYLGRAGEDIVEAVGGLITMEDLADDQAEWVDPLGVEVAGLTGWTIPPNSQGFLGPGALAVFEMLDPPPDPTDPQWWHLLIEAYRCLAWERDDIVGDPDHMPLPTHLYLDRERLERAAASVSPHRTGVWPEGVGALSGTAYLCVADGDGLAVSIMQSNYRGTGSPFGAARSGFLLQDRGGGFSTTRGHPNQLAPGKRPLHTLSPVLFTGGRAPRWLLGTRGGAVQPQLVSQIAARAILGGAPLDDALSAPRWTISDFGPGSRSSLRVEPGIEPRIVKALREKGHVIDEMDEPQAGWGPASVIEVDGEGRKAAADPRVDTTASMVW